MAATAAVLRPDEGFSADVALHPRHYLEQHVQENVLAACLSRLQGKSTQRVVTALLTHTSLDFRFGNVFGSYRDPGLHGSRPLSRQQLSRQAHVLRWLDQIDEILLAADLDQDSWLPAQMDQGDTDPQSEMSALLPEFAEFDELVADIMDEMSDRLGRAAAGEFEFGPDGWPVRWSLRSSDRAAFMSALHRFVGNEKRLHGSLLTPLVQSMVVQGPFRPRWADRYISLVLLDVAGHGQNAGDASGPAGTLTGWHFKWMANCDSILMVDNACKPADRETREVLAAVCYSGNVEKLSLLYTHVDEAIDGVVSLDRSDAISRVREIEANTIRGLAGRLPAATLAQLRDRLEGNTYFAGSLDQPMGADLITGQTDDQDGVESVADLRRLLSRLAVAAGAPDTVARPVYQRDRLAEAVRQATAEYLDMWITYVGDDRRSAAVNWSQLRAMTRRLGPMQRHSRRPDLSDLLEGYESLLPAVHLQKRLLRELHFVLRDPDLWTTTPSAAEQQVAIDEISQSVSVEIGTITRRRILAVPIDAWDVAYQYTGKGQAKLRARDIQTILATAVLEPGTAPPLVSEVLSSLATLRDADDQPRLIIR